MTTTEAPPASTTGAAAPPPARHRSIAVLRSEWIKATTLRSTALLVAATAVVGVLTSAAIAAFASDEFATDGAVAATDVFLFPMVLTAVLAAIAGIVVITSEVQHGTLPASFAAFPSRWPIAAAKVALTAAIGSVLGVVGMASGFAGSLLGGLEVGDGSGVATQVLWGLLYTVGAGLLGLGVGMVVRHSAGAISGLLVWWLVVEGLVVQFAPARVARFVPFDTGFRTLDVETDLDVAEVAAAGLSNPRHAAIFWSYVLLALVIGTWSLVRRDPD